MTALAQDAIKFLEEEADETLVKAVKEIVAEDRGEFQWDPAHASVAGLVTKEWHGSSNCALVIYFADRDFEVAGWFEEEVL